MQMCQNRAMGWPNKITPANAGGRPRFRFRGSHRWPGVAEFRRWTEKRDL
jgi:hypothetical protein